MCWLYTLGAGRVNKFRQRETPKKSLAASFLLSRNGADQLAQRLGAADQNGVRPAGAFRARRFRKITGNLINDFALAAQQALKDFNLFRGAVVQPRDLPRLGLSRMGGGREKQGHKQKCKEAKHGVMIRENLLTRCYCARLFLTVNRQTT